MPRVHLPSSQRILLRNRRESLQAGPLQPSAQIQSKARFLSIHKVKLCHFYGSRSPTEPDGGRKWLCQAASHPSYLPVIVPLFDEFVHHFLHLPVTLHLQVLDEGVQPPGSVVGLHNGLVGLHNASNPCRERGSTRKRLRQEIPSSLDPDQSSTGPNNGSFTPQIN